MWFSEDIEQMLGSRPNIYWLFSWSFAAPLLILVDIQRCLLFVVFNLVMLYSHIKQHEQ